MHSNLEKDIIFNFVLLGYILNHYEYRKYYSKRHQDTAKDYHSLKYKLKSEYI